MRACRYGQKDVVQLLLEHSERIELNERNNRGWTALMIACKKARKDVFKLLLEYSEFVDINIPDSFQISKQIKNLIDLHSIKGKMLKACEKGETKVVQLLLERWTSKESGLNIQSKLMGK